MAQQRLSVEEFLELKQMITKYDEITRTGKIKAGTVALAEEIVIKASKLHAATLHEHIIQNPEK